MSIRLGVDLQPISEIEESIRLFGDEYFKRVYDDRECRYARSHPDTAAAFLAGRFAGREAVIKTLEASDPFEIWHDIDLGDTWPSPKVLLRNEALRVAASDGVSQIFLSIAYCRGTVTAVAIADLSAPSEI